MHARTRPRRISRSLPKCRRDARRRVSLLRTPRVQSFGPAHVAVQLVAGELYSDARWISGEPNEGTLRAEEGGDGSRQSRASREGLVERAVAEGVRDEGAPSGASAARVREVDAPQASVRCLPRRCDASRGGGWGTGKSGKSGQPGRSRRACGRAGSAGRGSVVWRVGGARTGGR